MERTGEFLKQSELVSDHGGMSYKKKSDPFARFGFSPVPGSIPGRVNFFRSQERKEKKGDR